MSCETREQQHTREPVSSTKDANTEDQLRKKIISKISEKYNISYDELYKTIASGEQSIRNLSESSEDTDIHTDTRECSSEHITNVDANANTDTDVVSTKSNVNVPSLDRFKHDHMKKTLKELRELATAHNVSVHGTKEKIVEKIYSAVYGKVQTQKTKSSVQMPSSQPLSQPLQTAHVTHETKVQGHIASHVVKHDIGVDTSDLTDIVCDSEHIWFNIQRNMLAGYNSVASTSTPTTGTHKDVGDCSGGCGNNNAIFSKWGEIHTRDILLLLQTHKLSTAGTRDDWIARLKEFYNQVPTNSATTRPVEWNEEELKNANEELISRIDARPSFMKCIASAMPISVYVDSKGIRRVNATVPGKKMIVENDTRYVWIKERNWVFIEDSSSYEFVGCIIDDVVITCDLPNELLQMNE
jgi:hypothetical protein